MQQFFRLVFVLFVFSQHISTIVCSRVAKSVIPGLDLDWAKPEEANYDCDDEARKTQKHDSSENVVMNVFAKPGFSVDNFDSSMTTTTRPNQVDPVSENQNNAVDANAFEVNDPQPLAKEAFVFGKSRDSGGSIAVLEAANDDEQAIPIALAGGASTAVVPVVVPAPVPVTRAPAPEEEAPKEFSILDVNHAISEKDMHAIKVKNLREHFGSVLPADDAEGASYSSKAAPRPPPTDILLKTPAELSQNIQAVSPQRPQEGGNQTLRIIQSSASKASMPEPTSDTEASALTSAKCATCFGHPNNICNGHGTCSEGKCTCHHGWKGDNCTQRVCPGAKAECSGHGMCLSNTTCLCYDGWMSADCSQPWPGCPKPASNLPECSGIEHGDCLHILGICKCKDPWVGKDCSRMRCLGEPECNGRGTCWFGKCLCNAPYTGDDCSQVRCPGVQSECEGHGQCVDGACVCAPHWAGSDCAQYQCPGSPMCSGHGDCDVGGHCLCHPGWGGPECSVAHCGGANSDCNDHGTCNNGTCVCSPGWQGVTCDVHLCTDSSGDLVCSAHGQCWHGICECQPGWSGSDCSIERCPADCNKQGVCVNGSCICDGMWGGALCDRQRCATDNGLECAGHGECVRGHCICSNEWKGMVCQMQVCPGFDSLHPEKECSMHGTCANGTCVCEPSFTGVTCNERYCIGHPNHECSNHGTCTSESVCVCDKGWRGLDCGTQMCNGTPECSGSGMCVNASCVCNVGWKGDTCDTKSCPKTRDGLECGGNGECSINGTCVCSAPYTGAACELNDHCPGIPECSGHGICVAQRKVCVCDSGWRGKSCSVRVDFEGGQCEGESEWIECAHSIQATCNNPFGTSNVSPALPCQPGCQCPVGRLWDPIVRRCVFPAECDANVCGYDLAPLTSHVHLVVKTLPCNSTVAAPFSNTGCVCKGEPLTVCWQGGDSFVQTHDDAVSAILALEQKTLNVLSKETRDKVWLGMTDAEFDTLLPQGANVSISNVTYPHVDLSFASPAQQYAWSRGRTIRDSSLVPETDGAYILRYKLQRSRKDISTHRDIPYHVIYPGHFSFHVTDCAKRSCPGTNAECSGNGVCIGGSCRCDAGFTGNACERTTCLDGCGNGSCDRGEVCVCVEGWGGSTCNTPVCPVIPPHRLPCSEHGLCEDGKCQCNPGFGGVDCSVSLTTPVCDGGAVWTPCASTCPLTCGDNNSNSNTTCFQNATSNSTRCVGRCTCPSSRSFWDYSLRKCVSKDQCGFHACNTLLRTTNAKVDLTVETVVCRNAEDHKRCVCAHKPVSVCWKAGIEFVTQQIGSSQPFGISLHMDDGTFPGPLVARNSSIDLVLENLFGPGKKYPRHFQLNDSVLVPTNLETTLEAGSIMDDSRFFVPSFGAYEVHFWRSGSDELVASFDFYAQECPEASMNMQCPGGSADDGECSGRGSCVNHKCICEPGWEGEACGEAIVCPGYPLECSGHGVCHLFTCSCNYGWTGRDCSQSMCVLNCSGHGACYNGECSCEAGWKGFACGVDAREYDQCANDTLGAGFECSLHGNCVGGMCVCDYPYRGQYCNASMCPGYPTECSGRGKCNANTGTCSCDHGWAGLQCNDPTCVAPSQPSNAPACSGHGVCQLGRCGCFAGFSGEYCEQLKCGGEPMCHSPNGVCVNGSCVCVPGWKGATCGVRMCTGAGGECSGHGECRDGVCECSTGWKGASCDMIKCMGTPECNGRGTCNSQTGVCQCVDGWSGIGCADNGCVTTPNTPPCSDHGTCSNGTCICDSAYHGLDCSSPSCAQDSEGHVCSGIGICVQGVCNCPPNATGISCSIALCPNGCSDNGLCLDGTCFCDPNFYGLDCSIRGEVTYTPYLRSKATTFAATNNSHAIINSNETATHQMVEETSESTSNTEDEHQQQTEQQQQQQQQSHKGNCSANMVYVDCVAKKVGTCVSKHVVQVDKTQCVGGCQCPAGRVWDHLIARCTKPRHCRKRAQECSHNCLNGECANGHCSCRAGWTGRSCDLRVCPGTVSLSSESILECSNHGECINGTCRCFENFSGVSCEIVSCPHNCNSRGVCAKGLCQCSPRYSGPFCQYSVCPAGDNGEACSGVQRGVCNSTSGTCRCYSAFSGISCSFKKCLDACSGHGECDGETGTCKCIEGWTGSSCAGRECPNQCTNRGTCRADGTCSCHTGFRGLDCREVTCPLGRHKNMTVECSGNGKCDSGKCHCHAGFGGVACGERMCGVNCTAHGKCISGVCHCNPGRTGFDCTKLLCQSGCNSRGKCSAIGECVCDEGWTGLECDETVCPGSPVCSGRGECFASVCHCNQDYGGFECEVKLPEHSQRVTCEEGSALTFSPCVFPITYRNKTYTDCSTDYIHRPWCFTNANTSLNQWGVCAPPGTCGGSFGKECSGHGTCQIINNTREVVAKCKCEPGFMGDVCAHHVIRVVQESSTDPLAGGSLCVLPFVYQNKIYHNCTTEYRDDHMEWCAYLDENLVQSWGLCAPLGTCPGTPQCSGNGKCNENAKCECFPGYEGPACSNHIVRVTNGGLTRLGQPCVLPFSFLGLEFHDCTTAPSMTGDEWCPVDSGNVTSTTVWDYCAPVGTCLGEPQCSDKGQCVNGTCQCELGFTGPNCSAVMRTHEILRTFFHATKGTFWVSKSGWTAPPTQSIAFCTWEGVKCNSLSEIVSIVLTGNNLVGTIPPSIGLLSSLEILDLSANHLAGPIPTSLGRLTNLQSLNLANNLLSGQIPEQLLDIPTLQSLNVNQNILTDEDKVVRLLEHRLSSQLLCADNCINDSPVCVKRPDNCNQSPQTENDAVEEPSSHESDELEHHRDFEGVAIEDALRLFSDEKGRHCSQVVVESTSELSASPSPAPAAPEDSQPSPSSQLQQNNDDGGDGEEIAPSASATVSPPLEESNADEEQHDGVVLLEIDSGAHIGLTHCFVLLAAFAFIQMFFM